MLGRLAAPSVSRLSTVKVSAENGAIHRGDLLTTSTTPGHAMRASEFRVGTILGKAMGELESGTGIIQVLLTLQ